jgi:dGTPase
MSEFRRLLTLVQNVRLRASTRGALSNLLESESDRARVINSAPFRRLQQKAQVFPLDTNAAVRTRLTHSIEVSQVGRHIVQTIISKHGSTDGSYGDLAAFVNIVETACLLHDIGNPPFGHFGESAIRSWSTAMRRDPQEVCLIYVTLTETHKASDRYRS